MSTLPDPVKKFLKVSDLAEMFGVSPKAITRGARRGTLPRGDVETPGGHHRWIPSELVAFLRERGKPVPQALLDLIEAP